MKKDCYIRIRLSEEEKSLLKKLSELNHMTMTQYIIQLILKDNENLRRK